MRFKDINWLDVEQYLETDNRIILVLGSTEQHGYLSLSTDVSIADKLANAACGRDNVLIAPPINFGVGSQYEGFPGTISIARTTFDAILTDVVQGLLQHGFRNFLVINGHHGNRFPASLEHVIEDDYAQIVWFDWWQSHAVRAFELKHDLWVNHANWSENFAFNRVVPIPQSDNVSNAELQYDNESEITANADGSVGGCYQIDDRMMFQMFDSIVDEIVELLAQMRLTTESA